MAVNGFDDAKNKVSVYTTVEIENIKTNLMNELATKQDQHIATTEILTVAGWEWDSSGAPYRLTNTILVDGVTEANTVIVSPPPTYMDIYNNVGIACIGQGNGTLTFKANGTTVPPVNVDIPVNILILGV